MLLRHITARLAAEKKFTTSRVDFDYLSPDYPVRKPAQLLIELAEELRSYARDSKVEFLFEDFEKLVVQFHKELSAEPPADDPLANIRRPEFKQILRYFISALMSLPKPIVFVLDTCEELTKLPPVGDILPNVAATFEILEEIHGQVPETRVIFAGRRLLARSGNGWRAADASLAEGKKGYLPAEKKFLRLYEIRGIGEEKLDGQEESEIDLFFDYFFRRMEGSRRKAFQPLRPGSLRRLGGGGSKTGREDDPLRRYRPLRGAAHRQAHQRHPGA
jgi:hypothetical protein